jgi:hypothetical protein
MKGFGQIVIGTCIETFDFLFDITLAVSIRTGIRAVNGFAFCCSQLEPPLIRARHNPQPQDPAPALRLACTLRRHYESKRTL